MILAMRSEDRGTSSRPGGPDFDRHFRSVLGHFATGVAIVTALEHGKPHGLTIQSFSSLSLDPPLVMICPALSSTSWPSIARAGRLCVNVLGEGNADLARKFAASGTDKYLGVEWTPAPVTGSPIVAEAGAWIDCEIEGDFPGGDHRIVVCRVLDLDARPDMKPLVFFQSGYQRIISDREEAVGEIRSVVFATDDMDAACRYYSDGLGLPLMFRDGDRWAMFNGGGLNIALAGRDQPLSDDVAINIKVHDVDAALERAAAAGGQLSLIHI